MRTKLLVEILKLHGHVIPKKADLPILESVVIGNGKIQSSNLETYFVSEVEELKNISPVCVSYGKLLKIANSIKSDTVEFEKSLDAPHLFIKYNSSKFKIAIDNIDDFPPNPLLSLDTYNADVISEYTIKNILDAAKFTATDKLRPLMECVFVNKHYVVGTDAHIMYFPKRSMLDRQYSMLPFLVRKGVMPLLKSVKGDIIVQHGIKERITVETEAKVFDDIMLQLFCSADEKASQFIGDEEIIVPTIEARQIYKQETQMMIDLNAYEDGSYTIYKWKNHTVIDRTVPGRYPNFMNVIPVSNRNVIIPLNKLIIATNSASIADVKSNWVLHEETLLINAENTDEETEFNSQIPVNTNFRTDPTAILLTGVSNEFLLKILSFIKDKLEIDFSNMNESGMNNRALLMNKQFLLMPLMIKENIDIPIPAKEEEEAEEDVSDEELHSVLGTVMMEEITPTEEVTEKETPKDLFEI